MYLTHTDYTPTKYPFTRLTINVNCCTGFLNSPAGDCSATARTRSHQLNKQDNTYLKNVLGIMESTNLKVSKYPKFQRKGVTPGSYDPKLVYKSQYLKPGHQFPVKGDHLELNRLSESLGTKIGALHTALTFSRSQLGRVRVVPDQGTFEDGAKWLAPHVDKYNIVSLDTESCHISGALSFGIFGTMDGLVLIVDLRQTNGNLPAELRVLLDGRLVLGSGISGNDSRLMGGIDCKLGDTIPLSRKIQLHALYPYQVEMLHSRYQTRIETRPRNAIRPLLRSPGPGYSKEDQLR